MAVFQRFVHDREAVRFAGLRPKVHRAQAQPADFQARPSKMCEIHAVHTLSQVMLHFVKNDQLADAVE